MTTQPEAPLGTSGTNGAGRPATNRADVSTALALKADVTDGVLVNPTITGGTITGTAIVFSTLSLTGLPTAPTGLPAGAIWNNAGVLCIV